MTPKRKPLSALARLTASHMRLLKLLRGQIRELGELRKVILDMQPPKEFEVPMPPMTDDQRVKFEVAYRIGAEQWQKDTLEQQRGTTSPNDWPRL